MDAGWDHTELEAQTSTLSPNFMTPDKITSLLDVLVFVVFFFLVAN